MGRLVGQLVRELRAAQGRAIGKLRSDRALDILAAVDHAAGEVDLQLDRLRAVLADLKRALVLVAIRVTHDDPVLALDGDRRQGEIAGQRAELAECNRLLPHQPIARIEHIERVLPTRFDSVSILHRAADTAADEDPLPGPIGWPIRVQIASVRQRWGDAQSVE